MAGITGASTCADHNGRESGSARGARTPGPARRRVSLVKDTPAPRDRGPAGDPAPPAPGAPVDAAVFVDVSGRRRAWLRGMGWMVAASCVCFGATLAAVLSGADSAAPRLSLPGGVRTHDKAGTGAATPGEGPGRSAVRSPSPGGGLGAPPRPAQVDTTGGAVRADGSSAPAPAGTPPLTQPPPGPSRGTAAPSPSRRSTATPPGPSPTPPAGEATGSPSASAGDDPAGTGEPSASAPGGEPTEGTASPGALLERVSRLQASG
ncbi:hypothetical protein [Streptomyces sp. 142MFCol3.1]|uniref:hypothetical protein n=1 Tax=Streptomyces sp. 142MFCol3.1 TaxID=1172179 RepID=UPI00041B4353|nr:hypothetical protein [Streptomyces sp. 142MFCol3.1]